MNELKTSDGSPHIPEARALKQQKIESLPITFTEDDASHVQFPHHDPLVITIQVANRRIHRAFVDNGSSVNIMFKPTLEKIGLTDRDLRPYSTLLYGFRGDGTAYAGIIELAVTLGEYPLSVTKMIDFVVVDIKSAYNLIIGRPLLASLGAISSIRHLTLKFPTPRGVGIVRGDQLAARECYNISIRD